MCRTTYRMVRAVDCLVTALLVPALLLAALAPAQVFAQADSRGGEARGAAKDAVAIPSAAFTSLLQGLERGEGLPKPIPEVQWTGAGNRYTVLEAAAGRGGESGQVELAAYDAASGKRTVLVDAKRLVPSGAAAQLPIESYAWSEDGRQLLLLTHAQMVWRERTRGDYWVLRLDGGGGLRQVDAGASPQTLRFAKFSPDGGSVAYVRGNNLWVETLATGAVRQLTTDGSREEDGAFADAGVMNGSTDWVTEEELDLRDAFRWSPDSQRIAYLQFDETGVGEWTLVNNTAAEYPQLFRYHYPHPGGVNAAVRAGIVSAAGGPTRWLAPPGDTREHYIPRLEWLDDDTGTLSLVYLNRLQNDEQVWLADGKSGALRMLGEDRDAAWVDVMDDLDWLPERSGARAQELLQLSERDGWRHAYLLPRGDGKPRLITNFAADVMSVVHVDDEGGWLYFMASPDDPIRAYLYRSRLNGTGTPERVTPAAERGTHSYDVSPDGRWAVHSWSSAGQPPVTEMVHLPDHRVARVLLSDEELLRKRQQAGQAPAEFTETPVRDEHGGLVRLSTRVIKPAHFDPAKKYPVIVYLYGEPAEAEVLDEWLLPELQAMADEGYVVVSFDNEGTPAPRGRAWRKSVYGAIGVLSSRQQAEATREFARTHAYADGTRMGVWGSSGGGSGTLNLMFRSPGLFAAGVAVAPVPDERLYDSVYQERYMGLPAENAQGYHDGSPISYAEGLSGHLLLVHGSGDDNVHIQGTERLMNRLIELGKPFDFMEYPNRTHAFGGPGTSVHLYSLVMRYLEQYVPAGGR